jgi:Peptidase M50B-like
MPSSSFAAMVDRIGQTQAPLTATAATLVGLLVLMLVVLPTWLVVQHVNTIAHEGTHALVGSGMGGTVRSVTMQPDGRGLTRVRFPGSSGSVPFLFAGYLGPSAFGLGAAKLISVGHTVAVLWLALLLLAVLLTTVRNLFGGCAVVITGLLIYLVARHAAIGTETVVAYVITWFLLLSGFRVVLEHGPGADDAKALASATHVPRVVWSGMWLVGAGVALIVGGRLLV